MPEAVPVPAHPAVEQVEALVADIDAAKKNLAGLKAHLSTVRAALRDATRGKKRPASTPRQSRKRGLPKKPAPPAE